MNDTVFMFGVIPLTLGFIGFMFSLVFGADILRWYYDRLAVQEKQAHQQELAPVPVSKLAA